MRRNFVCRYNVDDARAQAVKKFDEPILSLSTKSDAAAFMVHIQIDLQVRQIRVDAVHIFGFVLPPHRLFRHLGIDRTT